MKLKHTMRPLEHKLRLRKKLVRFKRDVLFPLRRFATGGRPVTLKVGDVSFRMVPEGGEVAKTWSGGRFERREIQFILRCLSPQSVFFDIGANVGLFTIPAALKEPDCQIYAFEPTSTTADSLRKNVTLNQLSNVFVHNLAVADYCGTTTLFLNGQGRDGLNSIQKPSNPGTRIVGQEEVRVTTLDAFLEDKKVPVVNVIKVDVEGAELLVFRGAKQLLSRNDAPLILYESHTLNVGAFDYRLEDIRDFLWEHDFKLFMLNRTEQDPIA